MATQPRTLVTAEQFYQRPDEEGREYELLDGEVVEMSSATPRHNLVVSTLIGLLVPAIRGRGAVIPETDFSDGQYLTLRPDLAVLLGDKSAQLDLDRLPVATPPDIVVEVISPSESAFRVHRRIQAYLRFGVQEVWVIYPPDRHIQVNAGNGARSLGPADTLQTALLPGWSVPVNQLFER